MILPIIVATIAATVIGSIWYSKIGFGKQWMALTGITEESMNDFPRKKMATLYIVNFVATLVQLTVLAFLLVNIPITDGLQGAVLGVIVWLGFHLFVIVGSVLWEDKSIKLALINAGHYLVSLAVAGAILGAWIK